jgi:uncharacterized protein (TIGR04255 family)
MPTYKIPPVTEAVLEVRVGGPALNDADMEKLGNRFSERYPTPRQPSNNLGVELTGTTLRINQQNLGFKILSADGGFTVNVGRNALGTSKNAPYTGWEDFIGEARNNWTEWEKVAGWREVVRIGLRYINRIDVPIEKPGAALQLEHFFALYVETPQIPGFPAMTGFASYTEFMMAEKPIKVVINHAPTPSPLVLRSSFVLDLDVSMEQSLPKTEKTLWEAIEGLRSVKNSVFEACITDRTRELFS